MKRIIFLALFLTACFLSIKAQYTKLFDFEPATSGIGPTGSLISDGTFLYGMTHDGGLNYSGTIFKIKPDGTEYSKLFDFADTNGHRPEGSLISDGNFLYGMTNYGGTSDKGVVFKIKPDGTGFTKLVDFTGTNGSHPKGSLISDGTFLYGMTSWEGAIAGGTIFKIKHDGTGYATLHDFDGANGGVPYGSLISDGTFLFGMGYSSGSNALGVIFKIKHDGTGYTKLLDFAGTTNGSFPWGSLIIDGTFLYGMTYSGGTNDMGVIFKLKADGTGYTKLLDFTGVANGSEPQGSLISNGIFLYGMTYSGGTNNKGVLFKIKPDGTEYSKLLDFAGTTNGSFPWGTLMIDEPFLYGMTAFGGTNDAGVIFQYQFCTPFTSTLTIVPATCNNNNGSASSTPSGGTAPYTFLWSNGDTTSTVIGLPGQPTDTLIVTITDANGCMLTDTAFVSCVTGIAENNSAIGFIVHPNPSKGRFTIEIGGGQAAESEVEIYNVIGEAVYESTSSEQSSSISLDVPAGIYFIQIITEQGTVSRKIVVNE